MVTFPHDVAHRVLNGFVGPGRASMSRFWIGRRNCRSDMNATNSSRNRRRARHDKLECGSYLFAIALIHGVVPGASLADQPLQIDHVDGNVLDRVTRKLFGSGGFMLRDPWGCWLANVLSKTAVKADIGRRDELEPDRVEENLGRAQNGRDQVPIQPPFAAWCLNVTASNGGKGTCMGSFG